MKKYSKAELLKKISGAKKQSVDPELVEFRPKFLLLIDEYERQLSSLEDLDREKELWFATKKDKLKFSTLVYRVQRKIEKVISEEIVKDVKWGLSRKGAIDNMNKRLFASILMPNDKSAPISPKGIAKLIFNSSGFGIWRTALGEKLQKLMPETKKVYEVILPYEILVKLSDDFLIVGLEKEGADILGKLVSVHFGEKTNNRKR